MPPDCACTLLFSYSARSPEKFVEFLLMPPKGHEEAYPSRR